VRVDGEVVGQGGEEVGGKGELMLMGWEVEVLVGDIDDML
jgi:hypothetical protein